MKAGLKWVPAFGAAPAGIFGRSVSIVCGSCKAPSTVKLHECFTASDHDGRVMAHCSNCQTWNMTELVES